MSKYTGVISTTERAAFSTVVSMNSKIVTVPAWYPSAIPKLYLCFLSKQSFSLSSISFWPIFFGSKKVNSCNSSNWRLLFNLEIKSLQCRVLVFLKKFTGDFLNFINKIKVAGMYFTDTRSSTAD